MVFFSFLLVAGALCVACCLPAGAQTRIAQPLENVNSQADELMPVLAPDNKTIYFVRSAHPENIGGVTAGQDIWYSIRDTPAGAWSQPRNIGAPLNNSHNNAVGSITRQGQTLWLNNQYLARRKMKPGISFSSSNAAGWSQPQPLAIRHFKPLSGALGFFLAPGDSILFISMQADTTGADDIFVSRKQQGQWSPPVNIGPAVNTAGFEISPYLAPDNETLYFASNGHGGLGQADIFKTKRLDDSWRNWSPPENLGPEVNSAGFDAYFTLDPAGTYAYFTSEDRQKPDTDIYTIRVSDIVPALSPVAIAERLPAGKPSMDSRQDLAQPLVLYFAVGAATMAAGAEKALEHLVVYLRQHPGLTLTIAGHADDTGQPPRNKALSRERAQAVAQFLIRQGLKQEQVRVFGYGSSLPVSPHTAPEERAKNRRVEVTIGP